MLQGRRLRVATLNHLVTVFGVGFKFINPLVTVFAPPRPALPTQGCCSQLIQTSTNRWRADSGAKRDPYVDDITMLVVFDFPELLHVPEL